MSKAIIESLINIIYPQTCVSCNSPYADNENKVYICKACYFNIKRHTPPFCLKCGRGLGEIKSIQSGVCLTCANRHYHFQKAWSVCVYKGTIKELISKFKYNQKTQYKVIFQNLFKEFLETFRILRDVDMIIPVPLHPVRLREREYNQSETIAAIVSEIIQAPVFPDILVRIRNTKPQIDLDEETRIRNVTGCFAVKNHAALKAKTILLIDDVLTTGITLSEAARAIGEFNPNKISVLTLAS